MSVLLKDAIQPNLVQTIDGNAGAGPWRPLRQHRAWLQLSDRHPRPGSGSPTTL